MVDYGSYPTGTKVGTQTSGMSPEMEAKFLWYLDQVVANMKEPFAGQGTIAPQTVVGMTDAQQAAIDSATDPEGWKKYLNEYNCRNRIKSFRNENRNFGLFRLSI